MNSNDQIAVIPALPNQAGKANVSGLRRLWLIEARHLLGVIDPRKVAGALVNGWNLTEVGLQLAEDALIQSFKFPAERGDHVQKGSVTVQGVSYNQLVTLMVPKDHPLTALIVSRMSNRRWVAIYEDGNGLRKVIGTHKQPLRFLTEFKATPNGYTFSWSGDTKQPAYFFTDNGLLDSAHADAEFSYGFSDEFYT